MSGAFKYLDAETVNASVVKAAHIETTDITTDFPLGSGNVALCPGAFGNQIDSNASIAPFSLAPGIQFWSSATQAGYPNGASIAGALGMNFGSKTLYLPATSYLWQDISNNGTSGGQVTITINAYNTGDELVYTTTFVEDQYNGAPGNTIGNNSFFFNLPTNEGPMLRVVINLTITGRNGASVGYDVGWLSPFFLSAGF
jgi:hypothetical protein